MLTEVADVPLAVAEKMAVPEVDLRVTVVALDEDVARLPYWSSIAIVKGLEALVPCATTKALLVKASWVGGPAATEADIVAGNSPGDAAVSVGLPATVSP